MNNVESGGGYVYPECVFFAEEECAIGMLKPDCKSAVMGQVEQIAPAPQRVAPAETQPPPLQAQSQPADLLSAAAGLFSNLAETFSDKQKAARLTASLIEKDQRTGKQYLKIPLENEQVVTDALNTLNNVLSRLKK